MDADLTREIAAEVLDAAQAGSPLSLRGHGTKSWLGRDASGRALDLSGHRGILNYQPKELVLTALAGTPLRDIEAELSKSCQMLGFEPPHFAPGSVTSGATLGGVVATGLSGPARPYVGAVRDFVLGARIMTSHGEVLRFGGEVMKNVAGYDVSRLMAGAYGTLGILLDISLKVVPMPVASLTLTQRCRQPEALERVLSWSRFPLPLTGTCHDGERLWFRLAGTHEGVRAAAEQLGGDRAEDAEAESFWRSAIRDQGHPFFSGDAPLWRLSLPSGAPALDLPGAQLAEWGGMQRWLRGDIEPERIRSAVGAVGGHATLFRGGDRSGEVFHPLSAGLMRLHRRLKAAFDPHGILNPGRLYPEF